MSKTENSKMTDKTSHDVELINEAPDFVEIPRKQKLVDELDNSMRGESYHHRNPKTAHPSSAGGCKRRDYLNYLFHLRDDVENLRHDDRTTRTFWMGDVVHEDIQERFQERYGEQHVTAEKPVEIPLSKNWKIEGHADLVINKKAELTDESLVCDIKTAKYFEYYDKDEGRITYLLLYLV